MHTVHTRAPAASLRGTPGERSRFRDPRARGAAICAATERITRIFLHLRITRGARGRAGVGSVVLRYFYRCIQTRVRTRKSSPSRRRFQSYSSRWGIGETTTSAHRPERGRWEVGKRYTRHCTRTRPATCVLACEAVIRSRLSHLPLCQLLSQLLSATSGLGIQSILRRIGYGYR
jgi:hypothetical protein